MADQRFCAVMLMLALITLNVARDELSIWIAATAFGVSVGALCHPWIVQLHIWFRRRRRTPGP